MQGSINWMKTGRTVLIRIKTLSSAGDDLRGISTVCNLHGTARLLVELLDHGTHPLGLYPYAGCRKAEPTKKQQSIYDISLHLTISLYCSRASSVRSP